jgi:hypothetical protein
LLHDSTRQKKNSIDTMPMLYRGIQRKFWHFKLNLKFLIMKKIILSLIIFCFISKSAKSQELNGLTFGFGVGYSKLFNDLFEYTLRPDNFYMQRQQLPSTSFVVSSVVSFKFKKLKVDDKGKLTKSDDGTIGFQDRFSINASLDLLNIKSADVAFNKSINGGLGLGYFLSSNVQLALFYDIQSFRQMRDYIVEKYLEKQVPSGNGFLNALDPSNNTYFYNKTVSGLSLKIILSLGNKKG